MTRTQKLGLCTWLPEDPVSLAEMNDNFSRLDASGGRSLLLAEAGLVSLGGLMAAQAHQGGHAAYSDRIQTDAFRDGSQIVQNGGVYYGGTCAELLTTGLQSAIIWSNPGADSDNKSWNVSNLTAQITQTQQWFKLFDFDVPAFGVLSKLGYTVSISRRMTMKFAICDQNTQQELAVSELATTGTNEAVTLEAAISLLLDPNRRYSVYAWMENASSTSLKMTKLAFTITPQIFASAAVTMAPLAIPAGASRLVLLLHDSGSAVSAAIRYGSGEFAALTQDEQCADALPGGTDCTLRRYTLELPQTAQTAQLKLTLGSSACKLHDYALIAL